MFNFVFHVSAIASIAAPLVINNQYTENIATFAAYIVYVIAALYIGIVIAYINNVEKLRGIAREIPRWRSVFNGVFDTTIIVLLAIQGFFVPAGFWLFAVLSVLAAKEEIKEADEKGLTAPPDPV